MTDIRKILEISKDASFENQQLVILISDGVAASDQKGLRSAIRECEGKNIFVVFIIIDHPSNKQSIVDLPVSTHFNFT